MHQSGVATSGRESPIECSFVVYALRIKCDRILSQKPELEGGKEEKKFENFLYQARGVEQGEVHREEVVLVMQCNVMDNIVSSMIYVEWLYMYLRGL